MATAFIHHQQSQNQRRSQNERTKGSISSSNSSPSCPVSIINSHRYAIMAVGVNVLIAVAAYYAYQQYFRVDPSALVYTNLGAVEGKLGWSRDGRVFSQYLGIPYALPPTGQRRFEPPEPIQSWEGVLHTKFYKPSCLQFEHFATGMALGNEDCLHLNVFVSHVGASINKPVMVYIHGGIYHVGGSEFAGPKYFMDEDVILVTINYRLGSFGFLSTGDEIVSGNMGLKDQNMALRWIQDNIHHFGGDPKRVTIFGESAGGASVHHHLLSKESRGLFSKVIHQSGSSIHYWAVYRNVKEQSIRFARKLGCPSSSSVEMVNCLKGLDAQRIVSMHRELRQDFYRPQLITFVPTIEVPHAKSPFITEEPRQLLEEGRFARVPIMTGVNSNEGQLISKTVMSNQAKLDEANSNWEQWVPRMLHYPESRTDITWKLREFYFGSEKNINDTRFAQSFTDMIGDRFFIERGALAARLESKYTPTYLYYYDYSGAFNAGELLAYSEGAYLPGLINAGIYLAIQYLRQSFQMLPKRTAGNACHSDEIAMLFDRGMVHSVSTTHPDYQMSRDLVKLWVTFANNTLNGSPLQFRNLKWHPISISPSSSTSADDGVRYLRISDDPAVIPEPFQNRRIFWESLDVPSL